MWGSRLLTRRPDKHLLTLWVDRSGCRHTANQDPDLAEYVDPGGRLVQQPVPEVEQLRTDQVFSAQSSDVAPQQPLRIHGLTGPCFDLTFTMQRPPNVQQQQHACAGVLLRSWKHKGQSEQWSPDQPCAAAVIVDWHSKRLEVRNTAKAQDCMHGLMSGKCEQGIVQRSALGYARCHDGESAQQALDLTGTQKQVLA